MKIKLSQKRIIFACLVCFILTISSGILLSIFHQPFAIYIRVTEIAWSPPLELMIQSEDHILYGIPMTFEIWNPSKTTYTHETPNLNLVDPQMEIKLDGNYPCIASYLFWIHMTNHTIKPGITEYREGMDVQISNYNASTPPTGEYTVWSGIVGNPSFSVNSYQTEIHQYNDSYEISYDLGPTSWGRIIPLYRKLAPILLWLLAGGDVLVVFHFYWIKMKKKQK